eukprot:COSAG06_NODE_10008_length_1770_cov_2.041891_3_plen_71_part_00
MVGVATPQEDSCRVGVGLRKRNMIAGRVVAGGIGAEVGAAKVEASMEPGQAEAAGSLLLKLASCRSATVC